MNLKTCFALTASLCAGMALTGVQPLGTQAASVCLKIGAGHGGPARVACGQGMAVKVLRNANLWTSTDGMNWVKRLSGTASSLCDIVYGNGVFVAVGNEGALVTSRDGLSWTALMLRMDSRGRTEIHEQMGLLLEHTLSIEDSLFAVNIGVVSISERTPKAGITRQP